MLRTSSSVQSAEPPSLVALGKLKHNNLSHNALVSPAATSKVSSAETDSPLTPELNAVKSSASALGDPTLHPASESQKSDHQQPLYAGDKKRALERERSESGSAFPSLEYDSTSETAAPIRIWSSLPQSSTFSSRPSAAVISEQSEESAAGADPATGKFDDSGHALLPTFPHGRTVDPELDVAEQKVDADQHQRQKQQRPQGQQEEEQRSFPYHPTVEPPIHQQRPVLTAAVPNKGLPVSLAFFTGVAAPLTQSFGNNLADIPNLSPHNDHSQQHALGSDHSTPSSSIFRVALTAPIGFESRPTAAISSTASLEHGHPISNSTTQVTARSPRHTEHHEALPIANMGNPSGNFPHHVADFYRNPTHANVGQTHRQSPSLFDAFAPLASGSPALGGGGGGSSQSRTLNGAGPASAMAASDRVGQLRKGSDSSLLGHERHSIDALSNHLAATSLAGVGSAPPPTTMWPRRAGVVKFFNSTKGECHHD